MYSVFSVQKRPGGRLEGLVEVGRLPPRRRTARVVEEALLDLRVAVADHVDRHPAVGHLDDRQRVALEVGEHARLRPVEPPADLGQDRRVHEARGQVRRIAPVDVDAVAVAVKEHAQEEIARAEGLDPLADHGLLDRVGIAQREAPSAAKCRGSSRPRRG